MRQPGSKRLTGNFEGCNRSSQSAAAHTARPPSSAHRLNLVGIGAPATHSSIHATKRTVPDYGSGPRFTEGTANFLVNRRVNNQQQMRWSLRGADFLLQVCCASDMARSVPVSDRNFSPPMIHVRSGGCSLTPPRPLGSPVLYRNRGVKPMSHRAAQSVLVDSPKPRLSHLNIMS
jgi:hypothetical protein